MARHFPEPALVMLCFLWGIWLYDGYLGQPAEAPAATEQLALQSIDRRLRLADAFNERPAPLRWLARVPAFDDALDRALRQLHEVADLERMSNHGATVGGVLLVTAGRTDEAARTVGDAQTTEERLLEATLAKQPPTPKDAADLARLLQTPDARWWHLELARRQPADPTLAAAIADQQRRDDALAQRALAARAAVWLLVLGGAFCVPAAMRLFARLPRRLGADYRARWPLNLTLAVFLVCELAGIGISGAYGFLSSLLKSPPVALFLGLDSAARLVPAALACAFLFHRPRHAWRTFRVAAPLPWAALAGVFTLVFLLQESLHLALADWIPVDPTGGLDLWQAGWAGLISMLVSACIVAPIGEEVLYRGILFQGFANRFGPAIAAATSALVFTIVHFYGLYGTLSVGILGVTLALVYRATGSLTAAIALHAIHNLTVTLPDWIIDHGPL